MKARDAESIAARSYLSLLDVLTPIRGLTNAGERRINWRDAGMYFDGMADPYKVFSFTYTDASGKRITTNLSTGELLKIDRAGYEAGRNELSSILSELQTAGIVSTENPWTAGALAEYGHLGAPSEMLSSFPYTNDVFFADPNEKIEGIAVPRSVTAVYLTPAVFDKRVFSDDAAIRVMERIYAAVTLMHTSANCNPTVSPVVHMALNRLGTTAPMFAAMDATAMDPLVPKTSGIIERDVLRGAWSDNRFFGDPAGDRGIVYSNKNYYISGLGNARDTRVPDISRTGSIFDGDTTRFVNPCFPEALRPIHFATLPSAGAPPTSGLMVSGPFDARWKFSLSERKPLWTFADQGIAAPRRSGVGFGGSYPGSGNLYSQWSINNEFVDASFASWRNTVSRTDETRGPYGIIRRLRDWYYANKPSCELTVSDAITDLAAAVQLARFMAELPPHVLTHSVVGYHNALLKLSFQQVGVPYSTAIDQYELRMRIEREAIAANAARFNLIGHGTTEPGYALTVKAPDSVIMADAGLQATTVASLSVAAATCAANPVVGVVCLLLVGCGILVAELNGGRAQNLVTPRDRSKDVLRTKRNGGIRSNWFRGLTPEYVVNAQPVVRV